jgi:hypothetical protein
MPATVKNILKEEYNRLKKVFERITNSNKKEQQPQLVLQPYRNQPGDQGKKYLRGTDLR